MAVADTSIENYHLYRDSAATIAAWNMRTTARETSND